MVGRVCAVAIPEPGILPDAGVAVGASINADIAAEDRVIVVDDGVYSGTAWPALLPCKIKCD